MSFIAAAVISGAGSVIGSVISSRAARSAASTQANAANAATAQQQQMFDTLHGDQAPYRAAGATSLQEIMRQLGLADPSAPGGAGSGALLRNPTDISTLPPDFFSHQFDANDLKTNLAPNYAFMLDQGQRSTTNQANAMGGLGGNSLQAVNEFSQNYAQNAYQQAFNNYNAQRSGIFDRYNAGQTNIFNRLASIAGLGQTAGSNAATGASQFSSGIAGTIQGAGNAQAAGQVGAANALAGGIGGLSNSYLLSQILSRGSGANPALAAG